MNERVSTGVTRSKPGGEADDEPALVEPSTWEVVDRVSTGVSPHVVAISPEGRFARAAP